MCIRDRAGSTAYNRSLKGAVIDSGISLMQLTEITPIQHSKHRSLGVPYIMMENRIITMRLSLIHIYVVQVTWRI